eukprot:TRINITY_DN1678_c1_g1_i5.p1 TRINITY_DN1678_c1_g1~~TRINITY_DN1678_c1_g1_i5.p1  ORF type:complete len:474 (+),score=79.45 TRINITY_DN1678_c1_g1_i5:254-1675(+)
MADLSAAVWAAVAGTVVGSIVRRRWGLLTELRQRIQDSGQLQPTPADPDGAGYLGIHDATLLRYCRARKWDLEKAFAMYMCTLKWRRENDVDRFRRNAPCGAKPCGEAARVARKMGFRAVGGVEVHPEARLVERQEKEHFYRAFAGASSIGSDREGRPIYIERQGECSQSMSLIMKHLTRAEVIESHIRMQELALARIEENSKLAGRRVDGQFIVLDMATLSMWPNSDGLYLFKQIQKIDEAHYPETLGVQFTVNAPPIFTLVWRCVRGWLDPGTRAKIRIFGTDAAEWQKAIRQLVPPEELPTEYGGTLDFEVDRMRIDVDKAKEFASALYSHPVPLCRCCCDSARTAGESDNEECDLHTCCGTTEPGTARHRDGRPSPEPFPRMACTPPAGIKPVAMSPVNGAEPAGSVMSPLTGETPLLATGSAKHVQMDSPSSPPHKHASGAPLVAAKGKGGREEGAARPTACGCCVIS